MKIVFRAGFLLVFLGVLSAATVLQADVQPCANNSPGSPTNQNSAGSAPPEGDPYNPYSGNEYRKTPDLKIWGGVGQHQLVFARWANSRFTGGAQYFGSGHNWRHSYQWDIADAGLSATGKAQIEIIAPEGSDTLFTQNTSTPGTWNAPWSIAEVLTQGANGTDFYLQRQNGYRYHIVKSFNPDGSDYYLMTDFTDTAGNDYVLTYNASREVVQVIEPGGRFLKINYTNVSLNTIPFKTLATIVQQPLSGQYSTLTCNNSTAYRYLRYSSPDNSYCDVAEIQFYDTNGNLLKGKPFGTSPASASSHDYSKAFDGDTSTYVDYSQGSGGFVGIDLGEGNAAVVGSVRFLARSGYEARMLPPYAWYTPGYFQGSNQAPVSAPVIANVVSSDGRTVSYQYTPYADSTLPIVYQTLTSVQYDDGAKATYVYNQVTPSTPPLVVSYNDPRYELPYTQSATSYYNGLDQSLGEIHTQKNAQTGEALSTLTSIGFTFPIVTNGNAAIRYVNMDDGTGSYNGMTDGKGVITRQTYDSHGYIYSKKDGAGGLTTISNSSLNHPLTVNHPDASTAKYTRDSLDLPLSVTDELGNKTVVTRDSFHRPTQVTYADASTETFTYNAFGQPLTHKLRNGTLTQAVYDPTGLPLSSTDALGFTTRYTYDLQGRPATITDARGNVTAYGYDARGHVLSITHPDGTTHGFGYDNYGNKISETDELGHTTTWTYDVFNRCTSVTDALGRKTQYIFRSGYYTTKPDSLIDPAGKVTVFTYDAENHVLSQTVGYGTPDAASTFYTYDANYNLVKQTDAKGNVWVYVYDTRNRKIAQTDPLGNTTKFTYDAANNVLTVVRPDGGVTTNVYDKLHHLVQTTDPKGEVTSQTYDLAGNLITRKDAKNNTYSYTYDALNRIKSLQYPDGSVESYGYDAVGNQITYTNRAGRTKTSSFDSRNREISYTWSDETPGATRMFDATGKLLSSSNGFSSSTYLYDAANQLLSETQTNASIGVPWRVSYQYDLDGNRTTVTYPSGTTVSYAYTNRNQVYAINKSGAALAYYAYDLDGNLTSKTLVDGTTAYYAYDADNRLTTLNHTLAGASFARFDYGYDSVNRRTFEQRDSGKGDVFSYDPVDQVVGVQYDATTPNSTPTASARTIAYAYDATGNRTAVTDSVNGNTAYSVNNLNQYTSVGAVTYGYNGDGNLTSGNGIYIYDAQSRLESASVGGNVDSFFYDSKNRVVHRIVNGVNTYLVYDGWDLIEERDGGGNLAATYVHGVRQDELLSKTDAVKGTLYYHHNALGSVVDLTDASGAVVEKYKYDVFGKPSIADAAGNPLTASAYDNRFLFTGREWLAEVSLYDYRNRVYSADIGRFLQSDPMAFSAGDINIYRYCENNSLNYTDPTGESWLSTAGYFVAGVVTGVAVTAAIIAAAPFIGAAAAAVGTAALVEVGVDAVAAAVYANAAVTAGAGTLALVGTTAAVVNTEIAVGTAMQTGNWDQVAFDAGSFVGGIGTGLGIGAANGWDANIGGFDSDFNGMVSSGEISPTQNFINWLATMPTDGSGALAAGAVAAGLATFGGYAVCNQPQP